MLRTRNKALALGLIGLLSTTTLCGADQVLPQAHVDGSGVTYWPGGIRLAPSASVDTTNPANIHSGTFGPGVNLYSGMSTADIGGFVSTKNFGAVCNGTADDTAAFQAALNTGKSVYAPALGGRCKVSTVTATSCGQKLYGDGRRATMVYTTTPTAGLGTIVSAAPLICSGIDVQDIGFYYLQPDVTRPAGMTTYPPAIYANNQTGVRIRNVGLYCPSAGISAISANDTKIDDLQMIAWGIGINLDNVLDTTQINHLRWYPYSCVPGGGTNSGLLTNNQFQALYWQGAGRIVGINTGRADDLKISNSLFLGGLAINSYTSSYGVTFASITNSDFDTLGGLAVASGQWTVGGGQITVGQPIASNPGTIGVQNTGADLTIDGTWMLGTNPAGGTPMTGPFVLTTGGHTVITNSPRIDMSNVDQPFIQNQAQAIVTHNFMFRGPGTSGATVNYTQPFVFSQGRTTLMGNIMADASFSTGVFARFDADGANRVIGNTSIGWTYTCPGAPGTGLAPSAACPSPGTSVYMGN